MADNKLTAENKTWKLPIDIASNGSITKTLKTQDTYVDKDIEITINTPDATFEVEQEASVTAVVSTTDTTYTSETETPYAIEIAADATAEAVRVGTATAGFTADTDTVTVDGAEAEQVTKTIYVKEGHLAGESESAVEGNIELTKVGAQPESGFYVKASADGSVKVDVAGWLPKDASADADSEAFYTIKEAKLSNNETGDFTEVDAPVLTEDGYLFINEGYIANTKIALATLVPDDANITSENADKVYNTVKAYDKDGKLIVGTMGDAELSAITADDADATITSVSVAADGSAFKVTGTAAISGNASVAISKRGLAETSLSQTGVISGEANVDASLAKITLGIDADDDAITVTPVITKADATTAKSGAATTTAPTQGHYIAVSTDAIEASKEVKPSVTTEGYGTTEEFNATGATVTAGAAESGIYYIPLTAADHAVVEGESEVVAPVTTVSTDLSKGDVVAVTYATKAEGVKYVQIDALAQSTKGSVQTSAKCTSTEGYITASEKDIVIKEDVAVEDASATAKYIRVYDGEILVG